MSSAGNNLETFPWLKYFGNSTYTNLQDVKSLATEVFQDFKQEVDEHGPNSGIASGYLTGPNRPDEPDDVLTSMLVINVVGAAEPLVTVYYNIMLILAGHPEMQEKIRAEIAARRLQPPFVPAKDCQSPYIEAVLMECLRYTAPNQMIIHPALKDTMITGRLVPKDTNVIINLYAGHHDESAWKDPWVLRPERFLGNDGNLLPESDEVHKHFIAFGEGKKKCIGYPVVNDIMFSWITSLVDTFDASGVAGIDIPYDTRNWEGSALAAFPDKCPLKFTWDLTVL